jgi:hypothetical protein
MNWLSKHRPSPAAGIAFAALVVALGGVAFATIPDSSGTIHACYQKNGGSLRVVGSAAACRSSEQPLDWDQHGVPTGGGRVVTVLEANEVSTQSDQYLDLGGPCATVTVPASGLVSVFARAELRATPGGAGGGAVAAIFEEQGINPPTAALVTLSDTYVRKWTRTGDLGGSIDDEQLSGFGTQDRGGAGFLTFEISPGTHTICLRYRSRRGTPTADTAYFRERKLWVVPIT